MFEFADSDVPSCFLGIPVEKINKCMGDPEADTENQVLKTEQELQVEILFAFLIVTMFVWIHVCVAEM